MKPNPRDELNQLLRKILRYWIFYFVIITIIFWSLRGHPMKRLPGLIISELWLAINNVKIR
ncbi:MAG TPA: hypothetical protein DCS93_27750 [Microscillaceae bacterium]|nr:hypothetical protein [Microscillaceae bacterium]